MASMGTNPQRHPISRRFWNRGTILIGLAMLPVLVLAAPVVAGLVDPEFDPETERGWDAASACEKFIQDKWTLPIAPRIGLGVPSGHSPRWTVTGTLELQHKPADALISQPYTCVVRAEGDTFVLESLTGLP